MTLPTQIAMLDLFAEYCKNHHQNETLLLIENFEVESGEEIPDLNALILAKQHFSDVIIEPITIITSVVMIYRIAEDSVKKILDRSHDEKWGWGQCVYVWDKTKLLWGRD